jgi:RNA polymerase sigma factor (sigma-70 family)
MGPHDAAEIVITLQPAIRTLCRQYLPKGEWQDAQQDTTLHLLKVAKKARPSRARLKTYLNATAKNFLIDKARKLAKHRKRLPTHTIDDHDKAAPDTSQDRAVEELAGLILAAPHVHLTGFKARLIRAVTDHPHATGSELADMLGLQLSTLWPALSRVRNEITELLHTRCA